MATGDGTGTYAWVPPPPAELPAVGLIAALGPVGGPYLDPRDDWTLPAEPPAEPVRPQPPVADNPAGGERRPTPQQRWEQGFQYRPEHVCNGGAVDDPCSPDLTNIDAQPENVKAMPFVVWAGDRCSSFGWAANDYAGRATRALLAVESKLIARELWTGAQAAASGWPNPVLASPDSDVLTGGPVTPAQALDCLEQGIADCGSGARGAIHCTAQLGSAWSQLGNTLRTAGGLILTYRGTVIIPDAGYDGSGPLGEQASDGSQWAYATLMPQVRRGDVEVIPGSFAEATDRAANTIEWRADRLAAATFPACCHVAVEVDLPLCLTGGVS